MYWIPPDAQKEAPVPVAAEAPAPTKKRRKRKSKKAKGKKGKAAAKKTQPKKPAEEHKPTGDKPSDEQQQPTEAKNEGGEQPGGEQRGEEPTSEGESEEEKKAREEQVAEEKAADGDKAISDVAFFLVGSSGSATAAGTTPAFCGVRVEVRAKSKGLQAGATAEGYLWSGGPTKQFLALEGCNIDGEGNITAHATLRDVHLLGDGDSAEVHARLRADGLACDSEKPLVVKRLAAFSGESFRTVPSHPTPGFADITAKYEGSLAGDELTLKLRVKYLDGVRRWAIHAAGANMASDYRWADRTASGWKVWDKAQGQWVAYTGLVDPTTVREMVLVKKGGQWTASDSWWNQGPWPDQASLPSGQVSSSEVSRSVASIEEAWSNRFDLKRQGCEGGKDCCRWRVKVEVELSESVSRPHYEITLVGREGGAGRANVNNWYYFEEFMHGGVYQSTPSAVRKYVHAHEVGHMMGAYDEYVGGGVGPDNLIDSNSIMGSGVLGNLRSDSIPYPRHQRDMGAFLEQLAQAKSGRRWSFDVVLAGK